MFAKILDHVQGVVMELISSCIRQGGWRWAPRATEDGHVRYLGKDVGGTRVYSNEK